MSSKLKKVTIYTDGACKGNPGKGGWGAVLQSSGCEKEIYGGERHTTNNRMELTAAIEALHALKYPCEVNLYTDSSYVQKGISQWMAGWIKRGWKSSSGQVVKNRDLWEKLDALCHRHVIHWHWVKGHSGHPLNDRADALANLGADKLKQEQACGTK